MFVREKTARGHTYLYLVESESTDDLLADPAALAHASAGAELAKATRTERRFCKNFRLYELEQVYCRRGPHETSPTFTVVKYSSIYGDK
jgi:hypothetical protein